MWEWVGDWYGAYPTATVTDPRGASTGSNRVGRGGGWNVYPRGARVAVRDGFGPGYPYSYLGFRLARDL